MTKSQVHTRRRAKSIHAAKQSSLYTFRIARRAVSLRQQPQYAKEHKSTKIIIWITCGSSSQRSRSFNNKDNSVFIRCQLYTLTLCYANYVIRSRYPQE